MRRGIVAVALLWVLLAAPAGATTVTKRYGPINLAPYDVARGDEVFNIPKPDVDGFITKMSASLVYADGSEVPIANTMLHHVVMLDMGRYVGDKQDPTCDAFRRFDSQTFLPLRGLRFYGLGEERHKLLLPDGYGYPTRAEDNWAMTYMLMNHRPFAETVFIQYKMEIETERQLQPVTPVWLDVRDCNLDPVYNIAGGAPRGATTTETTTWTAPSAGRIVATAGHLHGGGKALVLRKPDCGQTLLRSKPEWGRRSHPYYQVRPLLHEPGPISTSYTQSAAGFPIAAGERLQLRSVYDAHRPHARVMGIMLVAFVPDPSVTQKCAPLPSDRRTFFTRHDGRKKELHVTVPISRWTGPPGRAKIIRRPPGRTVAFRTEPSVDIASYQFEPANISVRRGSRVRWRFFDSDLHNVTFANGPRAFSSDNLDAGNHYVHRFTRPGVYRLMCTLHPVDMTATIRVRR
jgi:plastocyanin